MKTVPQWRPSSAVIGFALLGGLAVGGAAASWLTPHDPFAVAAPALAPPNAGHWFGTDDLGRDVFAGVAHGARNSLSIGAVAGLIAGILGVAIGGAAGLSVGLFDHLLMRTTEFVQALPRFFLIVFVVSLFGSSFTLIVLVLGCTAWPSPARVFRAQVLAMTSRDFVAAARAAGAAESGILRRHILPLAAPVLAAQISYQAGGAILAEAGLSFLGLGDPSVMSWGTMLGAAQHFVREAWWMSLFPGLAVMLTVLGCNLVADSLVDRRDVASPS